MQCVILCVAGQTVVAGNGAIVEVFAGKPGRGRKSGSASSQSGVVEDWHRCVKHLTVSSRESQAHRLIDGSSGYWQSAGSQGKVSLYPHTLVGV